jgi:hypothetical protein
MLASLASDNSQLPTLKSQRSEMFLGSWELGFGIWEFCFGLPALNALAELI